MASATTSSPPTPQAAKSGLFKRIATKLRTPQASAPTPSTSISSVPDASQSIGKQKRKGNLHLPSIPRPKAPTPSYPNAFTSPEQREAALFARGLVPRRLRDVNGDTLPMSAQEAAHDMRFSMLVEEPGSSESDHESDAKRIREAWLSRNAVNEVGERVSQSSSSPDEREEEVVIGSPVSPRRPRIVEHTPPLASPSQAELRGTAGFGDSDTDDLDPADVPLPASPASTRRGKNGATPILDGAAPICSPSELGELAQGLGTPETSLTTAPAEANHSGTPKPSSQHPHPQSAPASPLRTKKTDSALPPLPPAPSTPLPPVPDSRPRALTLPTLTVSPPSRSTLDQAMPALSPTRTTSSTTTSDGPHTPHIDDSASSLRISTRQGKVSSTVATVIVESPVEDEDRVAELPSPKSASSRGSQESSKRMGLFKRNVSANKMQNTPELTKTARPSASLTNLRRSVTSKLSLNSRPKSSLVLDTSISSRSLPSSPPPSAYKNTVNTSPVPRLRQPLSPTMHSRGSILLQAKEIEDEESRRLSELAFLDF